MKLASINVGIPRDIVIKGKSVTTGIFKEPVKGRVMVRRLNLDGDRQADLSVHGGPSKAVYGYPAEHYPYWRAEFPDMELSYGMFGENLTTEGVLEDATHIGDRYRIGSAEVAVTGPRLPCYKLAARFGRDDIIKRFLQSGRTGFYFAVVQEGELEPGDEMTLIRPDRHHITVADITRLYWRDKDDLDTLRRVVQVEALPESWRAHFLKRIDTRSKRDERTP